MKKICITGASRGIGKSISDKFYGTNELHLLSSSLESYKSKQLENAHLYGYDLLDENGVDFFVKELTEKTQSLDVLVNNVGLFVLKNFEDHTESDINNLITINLRTGILLTKKLLPLLYKSKDPIIVFIASMASKSSIVGESVYSATKAGISNFAKVLRNEIGNEIRISIVNSRGVNTFGADDSIPLLRPTDVADTVKFITDLPKPVNIETVDIGHQAQWRGGNAPWSPSITD